MLHGAVNRAILSYALAGERIFLGHFEQAPGCVNLVDVGDDWPATAIVRAVNLAPLDLLHASTRLTTMEGYWAELEPYLHLIRKRIEAGRARPLVTLRRCAAASAGGLR